MAQAQPEHLPAAPGGPALPAVPAGAGGTTAFEQVILLQPTAGASGSPSGAPVPTAALQPSSPVQAWRDAGPLADPGFKAQGAGAGSNRYLMDPDTPTDPYRGLPVTPEEPGRAHPHTPPLLALTGYESPFAGAEPPFLDLLGPDPEGAAPGSMDARNFVPRTRPMVYSYPGSGAAYMVLPEVEGAPVPTLRIRDRNQPDWVHRLGPDGLERYPLTPGSVLELFPEPWTPGQECHLTDPEGKVIGSLELEVEPLSAGAGAGR